MPGSSASVQRLLYFYQSNQLDVLSHLLCSLIQKQPLANPLARQQILVQSPGMAQWLKLEMARTMGISANTDFPLPASFIWQMFHLVLDDVPEQSPFNKEAMAWRLMRILPGQLDQDPFSPLRFYLEGDEQHGGRKLWQLCQKIADIFDQYLVYRPQWTQAWEEGDDLSDISAAHPWQPLLWRLLVDDTVENMHNPYHRSNLFQDFVEAVERRQVGELEQLPQQVYVFGISALPPAYLKALEALGKHIEIHLFLTNPCCLYWGDIKDSNPQDSLSVGNPLLASMGKLGRDYIELLAQVNKHELDQQPFVEPQANTLLANIQRDILNLENPVDPLAFESSQHKRVVAETDRSVCLQLCHSPRRELEILHDQLLDMLAEDPSLSPRDIIVMVPDINTYSPLIQAVFSSRSGEQAIPFAISDCSATVESPVLLSFIEILGLSQNRAGASTILNLLEVPAIARHFGIELSAIPMLRQWVLESGVRWGLDADDMQRWSMPEGERNSWIFGLKRMLLGYAMDSNIGLHEGVLPFDEVQGLQARVLGRLAHFVDALIEVQKLWLSEQDAQQWQASLQRLVHDFYDFEAQELAEQQQLLSLIQKFHAGAESSQYRATISAQVALDYCRNQLSEQRGSQRFLAGQLNFCTLLPMRAIPFKVVCLLGLNDKDYPRSVAPVGFDLMASQPAQRGDRSRRDDDRYLFLEALGAAQDRLYLSYIAKSAVDDTQQEPSVLLAELKEYIGQCFCLEQDRDLDSDTSANKLLNALSTQHPLQAFSPRYYQKQSSLFSYQQRWLPLASQLQSGFDSSTSAVAVLEQLELEPDQQLADLQKFARAPSHCFFQRRLKVFYPRLEEQLVEAESFALDPLSRYQLDSQLLTARLKGQEFEALRLQHLASGLLPHAHFGELTLSQRWHELDALMSALDPYLPITKARQRVNLELERFTLQGWVEPHSAALIQYRAGSLRAPDVTQLWLNHLAYHAMQYPPLPSLLFGRSSSISLRPIDASLAKELLFAWLELYERSHNQTNIWAPRSVWAWYLKLWKPGEGLDDDPSKIAKAELAAKECFEGGFIMVGENQDPYLDQLLPDFSAQWPEMLALASPFVDPIFEYLESNNYE
ncbi:exodeoxyribonuclease V subunit gamma [Alginatibacterium sediminis]|uniref:exodeoxyribonuclease V subunit gamma n=1 Tax=Alginatibacterium sediminis TaxID=2164068 RepID=UPI001314EB19|nr:exodeoxyribonuclease V subunit gamma [Alginatibacterium sediminis]